MIMTVKM